MSLIRITGCTLGDTVFTTDESIFGQEIVWNITRIQRDADAGVFGKPETLPMSALPPMSTLASCNVDWDKVASLIGELALKGPDATLHKPALQVACYAAGTLYRIPVDGNHRICARRLAGLPDFSFYFVPLGLEARYRVTEEIVGG